VPVKVEEIARGARAGSRKLQDLKSEERSAILANIALTLEKRENEILEVNLLDIEAAEKRY
jgi:gamma-glutamyl phosphate reductase